jgi:predicted enzyme related to lactoylglutathione lyase
MSLLKGLSVVQFNITDWDRAKKFYGETLGLPVHFDTGQEVGWCEFGEHGKTTLAINLWRESSPPPRGGGTPVFDVDDPDKVIAELRKKGVKCDDPVTIPNMVTYANIYDPEGNEFQIAKSLAN